MADSVTGEPTAQGGTASNMADGAQIVPMQPFRLMDLPLETSYDDIQGTARCLDPCSLFD